MLNILKVLFYYENKNRTQYRNKKESFPIEFGGLDEILVFIPIHLYNISE